MRRAEAGIQVDKFYPPTDWLDNNNKQIDIRKNAENNSIVLLVGHSADFSKYSLLGLLVDTSAGTYDVYIDDVLVGSGITPSTQFDIDFSTINTSYGSATTPESLVLHKVVIKPTTSGATITKFQCRRTTGASGTQEQGILWCHFELDNYISIVAGFGLSNTYAERIMYALTSKGDFIKTGASFDALFFNANRIKYVPLFNVFGTDNSCFREAQNIKRIRCNTYSNDGTHVFVNTYKLEQIQCKNITTGVLSSNLFDNSRKLKVLPFKNNSQNNSDSCIVNANELYPTKIDISNKTGLTKIGTYGTSTYPMRGLRGLKVSNEAPFTGASPQINISYTGLDRDALRELFTSLPYNVGYTTNDTTVISSNGILTEGSINLSSRMYYVDIWNENNTFEYQLKFSTGNSLPSSSGAIFTFPVQKLDGTGNNRGGVEFSSSNGSLYIHTGYVDNSLVGVQVSLQTNTDYIVRVVKGSDNICNVYVSENGGDFVLKNSSVCNNTKPSTASNFIYSTIGNAISIDVKNSPIKVNGVYYFNGQTSMTKTLSLVGATGNNLTKVGSPTIDENGVASGFSSSNYITTGSAINLSTFANWKLKFKFKMGAIGTSRTLVVYGANLSIFSGGGNNRIYIQLNNSASNRINFIYTANEIVTIEFEQKESKIYVYANNELIHTFDFTILSNNNAFTFFRDSFDGSFYLQDCLIKTDSNYFVKGYLTDNDKNIALNKGWQLTLS